MRRATEGVQVLLAAALATLREIEWGARGGCCPACGRQQRQGHTAACPIVMVLDGDTNETTGQGQARRRPRRPAPADAGDQTDSDPQGSDQGDSGGTAPL